MRCCICHRPLLLKPAALIETRSGPMAFGPDCARRAGLTAKATRKRIELFSRKPRAKRHADQMTLELEVAA